MTGNIKPREGWRSVLHEIIFEADTPAGKGFDVILIVSIIVSVIIVMLDSVNTVNSTYGYILYYFEWFFTILFTIEYILRLLCIGNTFRYAVSFFGIIDLLAILPTYLSLLFPGGQYFIVIRILRLLRIFRVLKLVKYIGEANVLIEAFYASWRKITVFIFAVILMVVILGSLMYIIEGEQNGFTSIPKSIYWAIVTLTTVGYGDISPKTNIGQGLAAIIMIIGYGIIAVPTGIVTIEFSNSFGKNKYRVGCPECKEKRHDIDAACCKYCGAELNKSLKL
ncbi:MAG: ion transporter [Desulfobacterales bacterium]|nr:ion transporter [Desulfobacteraceae bacterium]MBT7086825.1 ion transporter [Desulfobacterales bacterium]